MLERGIHAMPHRGGLSITVPGAVRSWGDAHDRFGRLDRATLLAPAIELAQDGFPADEAFCRAVEASAPLFERELGPDSAGWTSIYRPAGRPWQLGERVRLPALAITLERIARNGWAEPYEGRPGRPPGSRPGPGRLGDLRRQDLVEHRSTWTEPIATDYRGVQVTGHRPNSSGFVALELLNILEQFEPPAEGPAEAGSAGPTSGSKRRSWRWPTATLHLTDPEHYRRRSSSCSTRAMPAISPGGSIPSRAATPPPARLPRGWGHDLARRRRRRGQCGQPDREQLRRLRFGHRRPADRHRLPEPGFVLQPRRGPARTSSARQSGPSTR